MTGSDCTSRMAVADVMPALFLASQTYSPAVEASTPEILRWNKFE